MANLLVALCLAVAAGPLASDRPEPPLAIVGAKAVLEPGAPAVDGVTVVIRHGLIEAVGADVHAPDDARVIDAEGYTLVASFVDAAHELKVDFQDHEMNPGRPADDGRDVFAGMLTTNRNGVSPERQLWRALGSGSTELKGHREAGFGALLAAPSGMALSGMGSWLLPNGRPAREALLGTDVAQFGSLSWRSGSWGQGGVQYPATLMGLMAHLRQALLDAQHHQALAQGFADGLAGPRPPVDPALDALVALLDGEQPLILRANEEEDIRLALGLAQDFPGLRLVIAGGREAWEVADLLAAAQVPVILDLDFPEEPEAPEKSKDDEDDEVADADDSAKSDAEQASSAEGASDSKRSKKDKDNEKKAKHEAWDPGTPTRLVADRHRIWTEQVSGASALLKVGVPVALGTFGRTAKELRESVLIAMEKGGLEAAQASTLLAAGAAHVLGDGAPVGQLQVGAQACLSGWNGSPTEKASKVAFSIVGGRLFDDRDRVEKEKESKGKSDDDEDEEDEDDEDQDEEVDDEPKEEVIAESNAEDDLLGSSDADAAEEGESEGEGDAKLSSYRRALKAAAEAAHEDVDWPVELDEDREPSFRTGGDVLVRGATIYTADDRTGLLEKADLLVSGGLIAAIGEDLEAPDGIRVVDGTGLFVAPGIIDCHAHVAIRGGVNEWTRIITPEVSIEDEVDPDDVGIYRALAGGTTTARLLHGSANSIGGRHEVVKFRWGSTAPEMVLEGAPRGVKFALGENPRQANWGDGARFPKTRMGVEVSLRRSFEEARRYQDAWAAHEAAAAGGAASMAPRRDLRLEALVGILGGEIAVHSHCYRAHEIVMLMRIAEEFGFKVATFQHVLEGYKVAAEIAAHGGLGGSTFVDWWGFKYEASEATPYNPALVHEAGALMSVNSDSGDHIRRLNLEAAKTIKYGDVPEREALKMVTMNPALQLGIADQVGSLHPGKSADFAVYSGHPFDVTSKVLMTFVDGELMFERREGRYDDWLAELSTRIEAGRAAVADQAEEDEGGLTVEGRDAPLDAELLTRLSAPRSATRAASTPTRPAPQAVVLVGGRVHTMTRGDDGFVVHEPGVVMLRDGRIEAVQAGDADVVALRAAGYDVRDVSGLDVWPGMIDAGAPLGIGEISMVKQSMDQREVGGNQADIRSSTAWHAASDQIPVARVNGVTSVLVPPSGQGVAGQSALMSLEGWTASDALVRDGVALHVSAPRTSRDPAEQLTAELEGCMGGVDAAPMDWTAGKEDKKPLPERLEKSWKQLREMFLEAREYARVGGVHGYDPRLEALAPYALGQAPIVFSADRADQIADTLDFADEFGLDITIAGGRAAWKVADRLALADVPVIVGPVMGMPLTRSDPYDSAYSNAGLLAAAGVRIAFRTDSAFDVRNLPYEAGMAVAFGLSEQDAMHALTAGAAEVLGLESELGQLAPGLRADVVVTQGSPLQITTRVRQVFVGGRDVGLESKHTELYETYRDRLHDPSRAFR